MVVVASLVRVSTGPGLRRGPVEKINATIEIVSSALL